MIDKILENIKLHWRAISMTIVITSLAVGVIGLVSGIFYSSAPSNAQPLTLVGERKIDQKIKGNRKSKIYHLPGCPNYNQISDENVVWFKTEDEARAAGYRKAMNC
jgi:deoxyribonuclease-1